MRVLVENVVVVVVVSQGAQVWAVVVVIGGCLGSVVVVVVVVSQGAQVGSVVVIGGRFGSLVVVVVVVVSQSPQGLPSQMLEVAVGGGFGSVRPLLASVRYVVWGGGKN